MMTPLHVEIDPASGFCFGVARAVAMAEEQLRTYGSLYSLGSLVHNNNEVERLEQMGLKIISREALRNLKNVRVLIRAHGEPPETYRIALQNGIELIDATCNVVLRLQGRIKEDAQIADAQNGQLVVYGKKGHPEVDGLLGQTDGKAILVSDNKPESLSLIDFSRPVILYCQTTQSLDGYANLVEAIKERIRVHHHGQNHFTTHDTICRQVAGRGPRLEAFARQQDLMLFVSGEESSNGRFLFDICRKINPRSFMISGPDQLKTEWFKAGDRVGVSGATSTPQWLLDQVALTTRNILMK